MTIAKIHEGLNETNRALYKDVSTASPADNATWTVTLPAQYRKVGSLPIVKAVLTYGAGAVGARTATFYPVVDTGSALVGVEVNSYVESTGVLTLTNRTGGVLATPTVILEVLGSVS